MPQVNLLPPEVRSRRNLRVAKGWMVLVLLLAVAAAAGWTFLATLDEEDAEDELVDAQEATVRLREEEAEYVDVPVVLDRLDTARNAQVISMYSDVLWEPFIGAITAVAPQPVSLDLVQIQGPSALTILEPPANVLNGPRMFQIDFEGRAQEMPDTAAWLDALNTIPHFQDPYFYAAPIEDDSGHIHYHFVARVQVSATALSDRFLIEDVIDEAAEASTDATDSAGAEGEEG